MKNTDWAELRKRHHGKADARRQDKQGWKPPSDKLTGSRPPDHKNLTKKSDTSVTRLDTWPRNCPKMESGGWPNATPNAKQVQVSPSQPPAVQNAEDPTDYLDSSLRAIRLVRVKLKDYPML